MPKASIVIPCYNAERFVRDTVASAQAQTIADIEIICVDDGSTDQTLAVLEELVAGDDRIQVISQENGGEGPARDAGLRAATGEWLYFLDADDLMLPNLLERAISRGEQTEADIVVFRTIMLDDQTAEQYVCDWSFKRDWVDEDVFCPREHPNHVFNSFQNWVHNKLFRGSFVRKHKLHMQQVHRTADLLFTCRALAEANLIALLDEPLYQYRVNNAESAMATSDSYPLDFYDGFVALKDSLVENQTWNLYHDSFVNWAIEGIAVNLRVTRSYEGFCTIVKKLWQEGFAELDIADFPRSKSDMAYYYDQIRPLVEGSVEESLFRIAKSFQGEQATTATIASNERMNVRRLEGNVARLEEDLKRERDTVAKRDRRIAILEAELASAREDFHNVTNSWSFKIGRAITAVPRGVLHVIRHRRPR